MGIVQPPQVDPHEDDVPDPDVLAYRLVARESPLDRAVLVELIGRPKRYGELKPLLGDKNDHNLTVSLKRLQDWGLIDRRTDARREPVAHTYELTPLGIQVVLAIPAIQPIHESVERFERARTHATLVDLRDHVMHGTPPHAFTGDTQTSPEVIVAMLSHIEHALARLAQQESPRAEPRLDEFT